MTVTLPTQRTKPNGTREAVDSALLGSEVRKVDLRQSFSEAVFFECEPGLNHLEVFKVPT